MMRWVDEITNRERLEELFFRKEIFFIKWSDHLIWSIEFYLITSSFNFSCINDSITNRICLFETIRIVDSSSICWFRVESFYDHSIEMIYSSRDDFFHIYWFSRSSRDQWARRWVCDSDEIRSKWQQSSKTAWSEENNFVTIEDLDSQSNLDESWDEKSVDEIVKEEFFHIELDFSPRLERQQLAIHSFVSQ
jgi:hypothetical protein